MSQEKSTLRRYTLWDDYSTILPYTGLTAATAASMVSKNTTSES